MFLENLFGNTFGLVWLIIFIVAVFSLLIWMFIKKGNISNENNEGVIGNKEIIEEVKDIQEENINESEVSFENVALEKTINNEYEIVASEDGFFRVKKIGNDRTLRKFSTRIEAENFIEKRGLKHD